MCLRATRYLVGKLRDRHAGWRCRKTACLTASIMIHFFATTRALLLLVGICRSGTAGIARSTSLVSDAEVGQDETDDIQFLTGAGQGVRLTAMGARGQGGLRM